MTSLPIKLLYLVSTLRRTGPTSQLLNIVRHLDRQRFAPVILTMSPEPPASMLPAFASLPVPVRSLAMSRLQGALRRDWQSAVARAIGPLHGAVVVHSQGLRPDVVSARHLASWPRIATVRNYPYDDYVMKYGWAIGRLMALAHVRALRAIPAVVACSSSLAGPLKECGIEASVIRNGVDTTAFGPADATTRARLRGELGLPTDRPVGACVGALSVRKDPLSVIRAVKSLGDLHVSIVFAGSGELERACREAAAGDDRFRFVGQVADVAPLLRSSDFFVSAAHSEGLPNSVLEALATGLPVVLSNIAPHRELLDMVPSAGELFATGDSRALTAAIAGVARRQPQAGHSGYGPLLDEISAERMSRRYQELYASLAEAGRTA